MKQYLRGYDLARFGLGGPLGLSMVQRSLNLSKRLWSTQGSSPRADVGTRKFVSHTRRFVVAPIPKVGTKSMKKMFQLLAADPGSNVDIAFLEAPLARCLANIGAGYEIFSVVRNPWSRALSCYQNKILSSRLGDLAIRSRYHGLSPAMSFNDFVRWLDSEQGQDGQADRHWISQSRLLCDDHGRLLCTQIGKFESFDADIRHFLETVGLGHLSIPHLNRTADSVDLFAYRAAYDSTAKAIIGRRYQTDIDMFEYAF